MRQQGGGSVLQQRWNTVKHIKFAARSYSASRKSALPAIWQQKPHGGGIGVCKISQIFAREAVHASTFSPLVRSHHASLLPIPPPPPTSKGINEFIKYLWVFLFTLAILIASGGAWAKLPDISIEVKPGEAGTNAEIVFRAEGLEGYGDAHTYVNNYPDEQYFQRGFCSYMYIEQDGKPVWWSHAGRDVTRYDAPLSSLKSLAGDWDKAGGVWEKALKTEDVYATDGLDPAKPYKVVWSLGREHPHIGGIIMVGLVSLTEEGKNVQNREVHPCRTTDWLDDPETITKVLFVSGVGEDAKVLDAEPADSGLSACVHGFALRSYDGSKSYDEGTSASCPQGYTDVGDSSTTQYSNGSGPARDSNKLCLCTKDLEKMMPKQVAWSAGKEPVCPWEKSVISQKELEIELSGFGYSGSLKEYIDGSGTHKFGGMFSSDRNDMYRSLGGNGAVFCMRSTLEYSGEKYIEYKSGVVKINPFSLDAGYNPPPRDWGYAEIPKNESYSLVLEVATIPTPQSSHLGENVCKKAQNLQWLDSALKIKYECVPPAPLDWKVEMEADANGNMPFTEQRRSAGAITISNISSGAAEAVAWQALIGGKVIASGTVPALAAGGSTNVAIDASGVENLDGAQVCVQVNPVDANTNARAFEESDYSNNEQCLKAAVPAVVEPDPVDPTPVDPTPVDPTPVDPTPVDPTPVDPTPVDPTPVDPTPVDPTPVDPTPVDPTPVDPTPVDPTPVDPTPVDPDPVPVVLPDLTVQATPDDADGNALFTKALQRNSSAFSISNAGEAAAAGVQWQALIGTEQVGSGTIASMPAGAAQTIMLAIDEEKLQGATVCVTVDPGNAIEESNESNNGPVCLPVKAQEEAPVQPSGPTPVPTLGEVGLLLSGLALAGAAAPALRRRREQQERKRA